MISLCMDSAYKQLVLGLYKDQELLAGISLEAFKKQSETIFVELNRLLKETNLDYKDIDRVIITKGPGSYTGIRIADDHCQSAVFTDAQRIIYDLNDAVVCR